VATLSALARPAASRLACELALDLGGVLARLAWLTLPARQLERHLARLRGDPGTEPFRPWPGRDGRR
jgi:hypothetical protein